MTAKESELLQQAKNGNKEAFDELFPIIYRKAYYIALKLCNCEADAYDIAQETVIQVQKSLNNLQELKAFDSWLSRIVRGKAIRLFSKNKMIYIPQETVQSVSAYEEKRNYLLPGKDLENDSEKEILRTLVNRLKPDQKEVVTLMYFENKKMHEISEMLGIPLNTVKTRAKRGRENLLVLVKEYEQAEGRCISFHLPPIASVGFIASITLWLKELRKQVATNIATISTCIGIGIAATLGVMYVYNQNLEQLNPLNSGIERSFQKVYYNGEWINNEFDAYYACMNFAHSMEKMNTKTKQELVEIQKVYQSLKDYDGVYYKKMQRRTWEDIYYKALNTFN